MQSRFEKGNRLPGPFLAANALLHEPVGMKNRAVIASAKRFADFAERSLGQFAGEVHRHLAGISDVGRTALACHIREPYVVMLGDAPLDLLDGDRPPRLLLQNVLQQVLDLLNRRLVAAERGIGGHPRERAFEPPDVGAHALREIIEDLGVEMDFERLRLLAENGDPRLRVRWLQLGGEAPVETRDQPRFESVQFGRRAIAGEDDLLMAIEKRIEGVEKLLLRTLAATEELDVVDEQHIGLPVTFA